jgi:hypothetical protein
MKNKELEKLFLIACIIESTEKNKNALIDFDVNEDDFTELSHTKLFNKLKQDKFDFINCYNEIIEVDYNLSLFLELKDKKIKLD